MLQEMMTRPSEPNVRTDSCCRTQRPYRLHLNLAAARLLLIAGGTVPNGDLGAYLRDLRGRSTCHAGDLEAVPSRPRCQICRMRRPASRLLCVLCLRLAGPCCWHERGCCVDCAAQPDAKRAWMPSCPGRQRRGYADLNHRRTVTRYTRQAARCLSLRWVGAALSTLCKSCTPLDVVCTDAIFEGPVVVVDGMDQYDARLSADRFFEGHVVHVRTFDCQLPGHRGGS